MKSSDVEEIDEDSFVDECDNFAEELCDSEDRGDNQDGALDEGRNENLGKNQDRDQGQSQGENHIEAQDEDKNENQVDDQDEVPQEVPPEDAPIKLNREQAKKVALAEKTLGYTFKGKRVLVSAITHPSANEGKSIKYSYERLEFLGDSILGAIVAYESFHKFSYLDEGGLTRIKVALVSGTHLAEVAKRLNFEDFIIFGSSERGTGKRGLHSALENVYEALIAALYLDGGIDAVYTFIEKSLLPYMDISLANEPENPKSALQERLQEDGITPTYKLLATQGPPHDRTFVAQVYAGDTGLAKGSGRTKKEAESQAAKSALERLGEFFARLKPSANRALKGEVEKSEKRASKKKARSADDVGVGRNSECI